MPKIDKLEIEAPPTKANGSAWLQWAAKAGIAILLAMGGYAAAIQEDLSELKAHHLVEEERWKTVERRLEKIENRLDELVRGK